MVKINIIQNSFSLSGQKIYFDKSIVEENLTIVPWESVPDWVHWNKILSWHFLCAAREQAKRKDEKIQ